jgi:hypothetical protein
VPLVTLMSFNPDSLLSKPAMHFAGTADGFGQSDASLLRMIVESVRYGSIAPRLLVSTLPRLGGAIVKGYGMEPQTITIEATVQVAVTGTEPNISNANWATYEARWKQYRYAGEFPLYDETGNQRPGVVFRSLIVLGPWQLTISNPRRWMNRVRIELVQMRT